MRYTSRRILAGSPFGVRSRLASAVGAAVGIAAIGLVTAGPAVAASAPPTVTSAFTPSETGVGDSTASAVSFTLTNPNASGTLSSVSLTDTLGPGLAVDDPNGENGTCGSASVITANPGGQTISLTGGSLKAGASCTISVSVVASQVGVLRNSTGPVSSSAGTNSTGATASLTVLPPPTVEVAKIRNNARYKYGQVVKPTYSCAQADDPTALADCSATDDLGNNIGSGQGLKTKLPGKHTLTVTATSTDGLSTSDTVNYTVLPDNAFKLTGLHVAGAELGFSLALPGPGAVKAVEIGAGHVTLARYKATVKRKRKLAVTLTPSSAVAGARVTLEVTYTPKGGVKRTVTKRGLG